MNDLTTTTIEWELQGDRYTRTDGNLEATLTLVEDGWKYEVWDMGSATPKWVASGERRHMADAEAMAEQEMRVQAVSVTCSQMLAEGIPATHIFKKN